MAATALSLIALLQSVCVIIVLAYGLTRTRAFAAILDGRRTKGTVALMVLIFSVFSIYGTLSGVPILGAVINIRDLGPALAGLLVGPVAGLGAGLIGGLHRYNLGGPTQYGCSLATLLAGLAGGLVYHCRHGRLPTTFQAVILALGIEMTHMIAIVALGRPVGTAFAVMRAAAIPMLVANAVGMAIFVFIVRNEILARETRRVKEAIEGELRVARDIQLGIVPRLFPAFPDRPEVELFAMLDSAKEVGGDFYDYYTLDDHRIFFVIGDVVGKGVPASLFMAVTMTLFKAYARADRGPASVMTKVNNKLAHDNETGLFVTAFCAVLDLDTGHLDFASAGHNLPVMVRPKKTTDFLPRTRGLVLGAMAEFPFQTGSLDMFPGDALVLYTDGVTEAMDENHTLFGNKRLLMTCQDNRYRAPQMLVQAIFEAVRAHAGKTPQSDDITIMAVRYLGTSPREFNLDSVNILK